MTHSSRSTSSLGRRTLAGVLVALVALVASCRPAEVILPPEDSIPVQATADPSEVVRTVTIPANDEVVFDLIVPSGLVAGNDVFYVELSADLALELRRTSNYGVLVASSTSGAFFASGAGALSEAALEGQVEPAGIGVSRVCGGSCVIRPLGDKLHARVRNTTGSSQVVDLYFFVDVLQDDTEPANDSRAGAPALATDDQGAIELIGDTDFWLAPSRRNIQLTQGASALAVRAVVVNANGVAVSDIYRNGDTFEVCEGQFVRVSADISNRAAAPGRSAYTLSSTPLSPDPNCDAPQAVSITANLNAGSPLHSVTLPPGGALFLDMNVPLSVRNRPATYFEISADLPLELRNAANTSTLASSSSSEFFAAGTSGLLLGTAEAQFEPQGIGTTVACRGSCVIFKPAQSRYVGLIVNEGGTSVSFDVYLYGDSLVDEGESANDARNTAPQLQTNDGGAIELIGDVDYFAVASSVSISFDPGPGIALQLEIVDSSGSTQLGPVGAGTYMVLAGEYLRVRAEDPQTAAASARSAYYLSPGAAVTEAQVLAQRSALSVPAGSH